MLDHVGAAETVRQAFQQVHGRLPTLAERQGVQALSARESSYGRGWHGSGEGSRNWGAISAGKPPCGDGSFQTTDSYPNDDGTQTQFEQCYRIYASDVDGAADVVRQLTTRRPTVWQAMRDGDLWGMGEALLDSHYMGSFGATRYERVANYVNPMSTIIREMAKANGEAEALTLSGGGSTFAQAAFLAIGIVGGIAFASFVLPALENEFLGDAFPRVTPDHSENRRIGDAIFARHLDWRLT